MELGYTFYCFVRRAGGVHLNLFGQPNVLLGCSSAQSRSSGHNLVRRHDLVRRVRELLENECPRRGADQGRHLVIVRHLAWERAHVVGELETRSNQPVLSLPCPVIYTGRAECRLLYVNVVMGVDYGGRTLVAAL